MPKLFSFNYLYLIPLLLSAIFSLKSFGLKWPKPYRIFSIYLVITLLTEVFAISWKWYLYKTDYWSFSKSNLWIYNSFHIIRYALFMLFYYRILQSTLAKKIIRWTALVTCLFSLINFLLIQSPHTMNNYSIILTNIFCVALTLAFFRQVLTELRIIQLGRHPMVWISLGSFIYFSGSLPFFIFFNYVFQENLDLAISLLNINHVLNVTMYLFYLIAFLCKPLSQK